MNSDNYPFHDSGKVFGYWGDLVVLALVMLLKVVTGSFKLEI